MTSENPRESDRVLVFTATLNERDNIEEFCRRTFSLPVEVDLLIVDDNSADGTGTRLDEIAEQEPRLSVVHRPRKLGLGSAHKLAMLHAIREEYDVLVTLDADFSHDPDTIPKLLSELESSDFVTGSRYAPGGKCDYAGYRKWVSVAANIAARTSLGIRLHEFTTSFRAFRVDMLRDLDLTDIRSQGYSFFLESLYRIHRRGFQVSEVPIHFHDRHAGQSKIPRFEIFRGMWKLMSLILNRAFGKKKEPNEHELGLTRPQGACYHCEQRYLIERFRGDSVAGTDFRAYRCTSMEHDSKPRVVACLSCGLQYVPEESLPPQLDDLYADVVDETYLENQAGRRRTFERAYRRFMTRWEVEHGPDKRGRLLEIGSYCGLFLEIAAADGWEVQGVEPSRWASQWCESEKRLPIHCGTIDDPEFDRVDTPYDAIVLWDVLEHVPDPERLLSRTHALLAENGLITLSTLDIDNWFPRLMGKRWPWYMDMHIFYFSRDSLDAIFQRAGYSLQEAETYCHYISVRYLFDKMKHLLPTLLALPFRLVGPLAPRSLFVPFRFGDIKEYVARRCTVPSEAELLEKPNSSKKRGTANQSGNEEVIPTEA